VTHDHHFDFAGYDRSGRLAVLVEAKRRDGTDVSWASKLRRNLLAHGDPPEADLFVVVVPDWLYVWRASSPIDALPDHVVDARPLLGPYFARVGVTAETIAPEAFEMLVSWWLDDLTRREVTEDSLIPSVLPNAVRGGRIEREAA
jgi:hypothetical protein